MSGKEVSQSKTTEEILLGFYQKMREFIDTMDPELRMLVFRELSTMDGAIDLELLLELKTTTHREIGRMYELAKEAGYVRQDVNPSVAHMMMVTSFSMMNSLYHQFGNSDANFSLLMGMSFNEVMEQVFQIFRYGVCAMPQPCQTGEERNPTS